MSALSKTLRVASVALCLLVALSFLLFAVNQTSTASGHQQAELAGGSAVTHAHGSHAQETGIHRNIDEVAEQVTAPVSGLSSSAWGEHALRLIFALLVYGFALGYLARVLRVRA